MDLLESLLGGNDNRGRGGNSITDLIQRFSRWIIGCGCLLVAVIIGGIALLVAGVISLGNEVILILVVAITVIAAVASLIRSSLSGR